MLRATTACTFSTSQLPKVVRSWCVLYILTSKCASRHNGVHSFDISTFEVKMYKTHHGRSTFGKLRCRKSARRCGAKHISKSKCTKHTSFGPLLEVEMSKKCTPLWREAISKSKCAKHTSFGPLLEVEMSKKCTPMWREAHFQVKMYKTLGVRTTFGSSDLEKVLWREAHFEVKMLKALWGSDHFWRFRCRFVSLHYTT